LLHTFSICAVCEQVVVEIPIGKVKYAGVAGGLYMASEKGTVLDSIRLMKLQVAVMMLDNLKIQGISFY